MFIIIPVKPFDQAKSRLAPLLSPSERRSLSRYLFERTLHLAQQVSDVVIISRDASARKMAKQQGAWALAEAGTDLNRAVHQATVWARARGAMATLILPGDLPRLTLADLTALIEAGRSEPAVVIGPCHRRAGTNALLRHPPDLIETAFGPNSFHNHCQAARAAHLEPIIYNSPTLAFDLDLPQDLKLWEQRRFEIRALWT